MNISFDSIVYFVHDVHAIAGWYAKVFQTEIYYENKDYAYINIGSTKLGFHPADNKNKAGSCGQTGYWAVSDIHAFSELLMAEGATLYRGPIVSDGQNICMLKDPFGNTLGLVSKR